MSEPFVNSSVTPSAAFSPLYQQIKALIVQSLRSGEWKPGESIPSELDLAARFQVSQGTVRKAIDELAAENVLIRRQGKGTFVATHHKSEVRYRFFRLMADDQDAPKKTAQSSFYECAKLKAPADIAENLHIKTSDSVLCVRRIMSFDDVPTVLEEIWLPVSIFKGLTLELLQENTSPLYGFFETHFGISMIKAEEKIRAVVANEQVANHLQVSVGVPLLQVERVSYTYGDKPVEIRRGLYQTDHYHYRNSLN